MTMTRNAIIVRQIMLAALLAVPLTAAAVQVRCYEEPGTRKHMCIDEKAVTANGDVRAAALYSGGPNAIDKTPYTVVVNCAKNVATLQDSSGVNFAGGMSSSSPAIRELASMICSASNPKKSAKLQQF
jgi:hypothetical protein